MIGRQKALSRCVTVIILIKISFKFITNKAAEKESPNARSSDNTEANQWIKMILKSLLASRA